MKIQRFFIIKFILKWKCLLFCDTVNILPCLFIIWWDIFYHIGYIQKWIKCNMRSSSYCQIRYISPIYRSFPSWTIKTATYVAVWNNGVHGFCFNHMVNSIVVMLPHNRWKLLFDQTYSVSFMALSSVWLECFLFVC